MNSNLKTFATYSKSLEEGALKIDFNTQLDFKNPKKSSLFGLDI